MTWIWFEYDEWLGLSPYNTVILYSWMMHHHVSCLLIRHKQKGLMKWLWNLIYSMKHMHTRISGMISTASVDHLAINIVNFKISSAIWWHFISDRLYTHCSLIMCSLYNPFEDIVGFLKILSFKTTTANCESTTGNFGNISWIAVTTLSGITVI